MPRLPPSIASQYTPTVYLLNIGQEKQRGLATC